MWCEYFNDNGGNWSEPELVAYDNGSVPYGQVVNCRKTILSDNDNKIHIINYENILDNTNKYVAAKLMYYYKEDGIWQKELVVKDTTNYTHTPYSIYKNNKIYTVYLQCKTGEDIYITSKVVNNVSIDNVFKNSIITAKSYPNPFNPQTTIEYNIKDSGNVKLSIYNILGQEIKVLENSYKNKGSYETVWNGKDKNGDEVVSGVYFYKIEVGSESVGKKLMLIK